VAPENTGKIPLPLDDNVLAAIFYFMYVLKKKKKTQSVDKPYA
jgi:hypothetical protein